ncbi:MAG: serine hydrolase, partial [Actinomycetes bacterium]
RTNDQTMVSRLTIDTQKPLINSWGDVDAALSRTGAHYSWQVSKVDNGNCEKVAGTNVADSLPLASIFKTYVLFALEEAVVAGRVRWDDLLTITAEAKKLGSSGFDSLPPGSRITVRQAAGKMIATSDNMATDLLIGRMGTKAIEQALIDAGHHDPASMTPFPTMREIFAIGWGNPDVREQWKSAPAADRGVLLQQANSRPYEPDPERTHSPGSAYGAEWYGTAEDICRVHARLQHNAVGPAAPVRDIMSEIAGIDLDRTEWPYIGAKAGNLPGDLTFSWYAVDRTGQPWVVSFQLNWPRFHSPNAGGWVMTIIKQVFGMLPRYR